MKLRVAVLYGGRSGEHEVSLRSAESIMAAMDPGKYEIVRLFITKEGKWEPRPILPEPGANPGIDVVFPVLHGTFGEDGTVQGLLELAGLPYVGPGVLASSVAMDKDVMKRLCRETGPAGGGVRGAVARPARMSRTAFGYPVFVKPANLGSSVGISKASNADELRTALAVAAQYDRKIIVERGDRRAGTRVLRARQRESVRVPALRRFCPRAISTTTKTSTCSTGRRPWCRRDLPDALTAEIRRLAVACYQAAECEGMARVDFLLEGATGRLYINEINTIPGFTSISMYPKMWEATGVPYAELIDRLIALALERDQSRKATKYSRT